jgi:bifunctional non-homologous end joining protein LigD
MHDQPAKPGKRVRHNWLLIKEKDEYAQPGEPDALLAADTSVSTGRTLDEIASSKKPRVWNSNRDGGGGGEEKAAKEPRAKTVLKKKTPIPRAKARSKH